MKFVRDSLVPEEKDINEMHRLINENNSQLAADAQPVEPENPLVNENANRHGRVNRVSNLRMSPNSESEIIDVLPIGTRIDILRSDREYYKTTYGSKTGYILKNCVDEIR